MFSYEFDEISKNTFFTEHLWTTASELTVWIHDCLLSLAFSSSHNMKSDGCLELPVSPY